MFWRITLRNHASGERWDMVTGGNTPQEALQTILRRKSVVDWIVEMNKMQERQSIFDVDARYFHIEINEYTTREHYGDGSARHIKREKIV